MAVVSDYPTLARLPLWGQALIAGRMLRRAALTLTAEGCPHRPLLLAASDAIEACAVEGSGTHRCSEVFAAAVNIMRSRNPDISPELRIAGECAYYACDAANAAEAAQDFPVDATVTASTLKAVSSIDRCPNIPSLQIAMLLASDIDQVGFASGEIGVTRYQGLTRHVPGRLTPARALTLAPSPRCGAATTR